MGWRRASLGEVLDVKHGFAFKSEFFTQERAPHVLVTPGNFLDEGGFKWASKQKFYNGPVDDRFVLKKGDLLVAMTEQAEGLLGSCLRIPGKDSFLHNQRLGKVLCSDALDDRYAYYLLNWSGVRRPVRATSSGTKVRHTSPARIREVEIPLPPLPIQRRIAEILSAYDDLIEVNTRRIKALEEMARRTYEERFGRRAIASVDSAPTDSNTEWWALEEIASEVRDGVDPGSVDATTRYIGLEHLPRRSLTLTEWGDSASTVSTKLEFAPGDVLFGKIRPYFHKVGYASFSGITSSDTIVIRPHEAEFRALVTMAAFSDAFVEHAVQTSNGTKMPRASWAVLKRYGVPKVDAGTLARFSNGVLPQLDLAASLATQNTNLRAQRDLLLPRLVSGAIDVSEAEATLPEPVEVAAE